MTEKMPSIYPDNTKLFSKWKDINKTKAILPKGFRTVSYWFHENVMILNSKMSLYVYCKKQRNKTLTFKDVYHKVNKEEVIFGINFNNKLIL